MKKKIKDVFSPRAVFAKRFKTDEKYPDFARRKDRKDKYVTKGGKPKGKFVLSKDGLGFASIGDELSFEGYTFSVTYIGSNKTKEVKIGTRGFTITPLEGTIIEERHLEKIDLTDKTKEEINDFFGADIPDNIDISKINALKCIASYYENGYTSYAEFYMPIIMWKYEYHMIIHYETETNGMQQSGYAEQRDWHYQSINPVYDIDITKYSDIKNGDILFNTCPLIMGAGIMSYPDGFVNYGGTDDWFVSYERVKSAQLYWPTLTSEEDLDNKTSKIGIFVETDPSDSWITIPNIINKSNGIIIIDSKFPFYFVKTPVYTHLASINETFPFHKFFLPVQPTNTDPLYWPYSYSAGDDIDDSLPGYFHAIHMFFRKCKNRTADIIKNRENPWDIINFTGYYIRTCILPFGLNTYYESSILAKEHVYKHELILENTTPWRSKPDGWGRFYVSGIGETIGDKEYINYENETIQDVDETEHENNMIEVVEYNEYHSDIRLNNFNTYSNVFLAGKYMRENDEKVYCIKFHLWLPTTWEPSYDKYDDNGNRKDLNLCSMIGDMCHDTMSIVIDNRIIYDYDNVEGHYRSTNVRGHFTSVGNSYHTMDFGAKDNIPYPYNSDSIAGNGPYYYGILSGEAEGTYKYEGLEDLAYKAKTTVKISNYSNHYTFNSPEEWAKSCCDIWAQEHGYIILSN